MFAGFRPTAFLLALAFAAMAPSASVHAGDEDIPDDVREVYVGKKFKYPILDVRPTQVGIGMRAVRDKLDAYSEMSHDELKHELKKNPIPVVLAPDGKLYMIDHHHQALAAYKEGRENAWYRLEKDFQHLGNSNDSEEERMKLFWEKMKEKKWVRPLDENGKPIKIPDGLPKKITGTKDDPFRSLAYFVREDGGYKKTKVEFAEFLWADFFRTRIRLGKTKSEFDGGVERALKLAHSPEAKKLPGYRGKKGTDLACLWWLAPIAAVDQGLSRQGPDDTN